MSIDKPYNIRSLLSQYIAGTLDETALRTQLGAAVPLAALRDLVGTMLEFGTHTITIVDRDHTKGVSADAVVIGDLLLQIQRSTTTVQGSQTNITGDVAGPAMSGTYHGPVTVIINQANPSLPPVVSSTLRDVAGPSQVMLIMDGFQALYARMNERAVYAAVMAGRDQFSLMIYKLRELSCYKGLHELFHQLADKVRVLDDHRSYLASDSSVWRRLPRLESDVYESIKGIIENTSVNVEFLGSPMWLAKLSKAQAELRGGVEQCSATRCEQALASLNDVLGRVPDNLNGRLVSVVENLPLASLRRSLDQVATCLGSVSSQTTSDRQVARFLAAVAALDTLGARIVRLVEDHNAFQEIENELRCLADDFTQLHWLWYPIFEKQQQICRGNPASWAADLAKSAYELDQALALGNLDRAQTSFEHYQSRVNRTFAATDRDLFICCATLQQITPGLELVFDAVA